MASKVINDKIVSVLNDNQKRFCVEYLKDLNATRSYQEVYKCDYETANANGSRLLVNDSVKQYINKLIDEYAENLCDVSVGEVVANVKKIALDTKNRSGDRLKAWQLIGTHLGMFVEKKEVTLTNTNINISEEELDKKLRELE